MNSPITLDYIRTSKKSQDGQEQIEILENHFPSSLTFVHFDLGVDGDSPLEDRARFTQVVSDIREKSPSTSITIRSTHPDRILKALNISDIISSWEFLQAHHIELQFVSAPPMIRVRGVSKTRLKKSIYDLVLDRMLELGHAHRFIQKPFKATFPPLDSLLDCAVTDLKSLSRHPHGTSKTFRRFACASRVFGIYNELLRLINNLADHRNRDPGGWGSAAAHYDVFHVVVDLERRGLTPTAIASNLDGRFKPLRGKFFNRDAARALLSSPGYMAYKKGVHIPDTPGYKRTPPPSGFFKKQRQALEILAEGHNLLFLIRTGFGKTLVALEHYCYLSTLFPDHLTIFVVPYKALAEFLCNKYGGIALMGSMSDPANVANLRSLQQGTEGGLLFITPDKLQPGVLVNQNIIAAIKQRSSRFLVVDEVDCVLEDADYRDAYLNFNKAVRAIQPTQVLALTASASRGYVRHYIRRNILLPTQDWKVLTGSLNRRNLFYQHAHLNNITARKAHLVKIVRRAQKKQWTGIIYIDTKKQVDRTWRLLFDLGFPVARYHSSRPDVENLDAIQGFQNNRYDIVVATSGFGRGLDFPVDFVVVAHTPSNLSSLTQYFGRSGRDGRPAHCWWLTTDADFWFLDHVDKSLWTSKLKSSAKEYLSSQIQAIQSATRHADSRCLRGILLKSQNRKPPEVIDPKNCCLNCSRAADRRAS
ncbi:MAG: DEAD/DEAH box helicase [Planctomycetes bacterium]|nr:DEAD/DEAH box helicase [Planctomycetota bacterium]